MTATENGFIIISSSRLTGDGVRRAGKRAGKQAGTARHAGRETRRERYCDSSSNSRREEGKCAEEQDKRLRLVLQQL